MEKRRDNHITIIVGGSPVADELRRSLIRASVPHAGVATHLRGVRRALVLGEAPLAILCIVLDRATLARHGESLHQILGDRFGMPTPLRSVGLLTDLGFTTEVAELGCDVYIEHSDEVGDAIRWLIEHWQDTTDRTMVGRITWQAGDDGQWLSSPKASLNRRGQDCLAPVRIQRLTEQDVPRDADPGANDLLLPRDRWGAPASDGWGDGTAPD